MGCGEVELGEEADCEEVPLEASLLDEEPEVEVGEDEEPPSVDEEVEELVDVPVEVADEKPDDDLVEVPNVDECLDEEVVEDGESVDEDGASVEVDDEEDEDEDEVTDLPLPNVPSTLVLDFLILSKEPV